MKLQRDRKITIKPCDKGAGTIILDFEEYMKACESHLKSQQSDKERNIHNCFIEVIILKWTTQHLKMQKVKYCMF